MAAAKMTAAETKAMVVMMEGMVKLAAVAGKGAEGKPCGSHSPAVKCVAELCCGNFDVPANELAMAEAVYGKDMTTKMMLLSSSCQKKAATSVKDDKGKAKPWKCAATNLVASAAALFAVSYMM